ncbi:HD-GYP domain-containing protein [Virgibacillus sp. W0430]|uniref:HD-GYP domain-containing protein n=1 Tax=Virgibacillus sp. W0430 TaxID=3391580 RepID=UPI003F4586EE
MRLVSTRSIQPGAKIGQPIYNENSIPLIQRGTVLTEKMINRLIKQNISFVYIEDEITEDVYIADLVPPKVRIKAMRTLKEIFGDLKKGDLGSNAYILETKSKDLLHIIDVIMQEVKDSSKTISILADMFATDDYIFQHSINVTIYSLAIGVQLKLSPKQLKELGFGAMLHDVGKMFIDETILQKPAKLTDIEFEVMKTHTELGYNFLRNQNTVSSVVAHCAYQHHERLDGSGYPRGITGSEMHLFSKIIAIADVFDAVTSNRVYRTAMLPHEGLELLYAGAVNQFEKEFVEAFKKSVAVYPNGLSVKLNDGRAGVIISQNKILCDRPVVRILKDEFNKIIKPYEVDLAMNTHIMITSCQAE